MASNAIRWFCQLVVLIIPQTTKDTLRSFGESKWGKKIADKLPFRSRLVAIQVKKGAFASNQHKDISDDNNTIHPTELQEIALLEQHQNSVSCLCVWGDNLVSASYDHHIKLWNFPRTVIRSWEAHHGYITCLVIWDGFLVSGSCDKTVKVWNKNGECLQTMEGHNHWIWCLAVWNNFLCTASLDDTIKIWDRTGRNVQTLIGHTAAVYSLLSMNSDNNNASKKNVEEEAVLWSGSADRTIRLWNLSFRCKQVIKAKTPVRCLIRWKGRIYAGCENGSIQAYTPEGILQEVVKQHANYVWCFSIFRDQLVSGSCDRAIILFRNGFKTKRHNASVLTLCVWKGLLWSGSADKTIRGWKDKKPWKITKLLWIAFYKERENAKCYLALLPKELMSEVIMYL